MTNENEILAAFWPIRRPTPRTHATQHRTVGQARVGGSSTVSMTLLIEAVITNASDRFIAVVQPLGDDKPLCLPLFSHIEAEGIYQARVLATERAMQHALGGGCTQLSVLVDGTIASILTHHLNRWRGGLSRTGRRLVAQGAWSGIRRLKAQFTKFAAISLANVTPSLKRTHKNMKAAAKAQALKGPADRRHPESMGARASETFSGGTDHS